MVYYEKDVEQEAKDFLDNHEDDLKEAIKEGKDFDRNDIDDLDSWFHEEITDRAYSLEDAAFVLAHSSEVETDSGLWEGQDPGDAISTQAAFTFSNDVWFKCEEIYKEIKEEYESQKTEIDEKTEDEDKTEQENGKLLDKLFQQYTSTKLEPVDQGSVEEKRLIEKWLNLNKDSGLWGGYPVGSSYIDARCGTGHGMPDVKDYVDFDHELAQQVPHLSGKYKDAVQAYYNSTFGVGAMIETFLSKAKSFSVEHKISIKIEVDGKTYTFGTEQQITS